jgi:hypothetical protein
MTFGIQAQNLYEKTQRTSCQPVTKILAMPLVSGAEFSRNDFPSTHWSVMLSILESYK